jgi:lipid II:glycine glycyltransferase (peptidoglycan interpeptide bridge formation enzyme)
MIAGTGSAARALGGTGRRTGHVTSGRAAAVLSVSVSDQIDDPEWDDFLERLPGGNFVQASCWGRVHATVGWRPNRVVLRQDGRVIAGAQMETRPMPVLGRIGFVRRGPVVPEDRPEVTALVIDEVLAMARANGVGYLVAQTPMGCCWVDEEMARRGFRDGPFDIDIGATVLVPHTDAESMFAALSAKCRQHVRLGLRRGVTVRTGSEADLPIYYRLKDVHSQRLGYGRRPDAYYAEMWAALAPRGRVKLFIAEYEGAPVAAQLVIAFGDTVHDLERPWSGEHGVVNPNEVLVWETLERIGAEGYRFSDLYEIQRPLAESILAGRGILEDPMYSADRFKLKFGGEVVMCPPSYHYILNPALRVAHRSIPSAAMRSRWMNRLACRFREGGS